MITATYTYRLEDLEQVARQLITQFKTKTVLFNGAMGSGKTTMIKALVNALGSNDDVSSPTFSIVNEYQLPNDRLFHFDFYRIESIDEAYDFGIEDYLDSDAWLFMEWPDRIEELLPDTYHTIDIAINDDKTRTLKLTISTNTLTELYAENSP
ncbi:tRNA (adenosine(37)-N6)-threonylcarbamoyltransferase complex ATPase subunit type 1 TsaE [Winogradskyella maritima]|uniref:tRNA threonylcarbamoyladenosine biosynthesis protein TsaE n=1 Tax=Winogradskyella maritima TaxID=1517766 RepID=A0ABV8AJ58_9FLAO|nr:tRNA (adenosine(37)-N6)-threonylcarbamoyltransferase complex ATPase subunit type 1 TsaE [Winogradskyella maritima]